MDNVWRLFPNASLMSSNKLGDRDSETMMFDGCLGRLQRNASDVALSLVPFPFPGKGLLHGTTASASKIVMWSAYNNTAVPSDIDVMDAFNSFTDQLWVLTFLTTAILTVVIFFIFRFKFLSLPESKAKGGPLFRLTKRQRTRSCMNQALIIITANILKQHTSYSFRGKLLRRRIILFLIAVFSFLIMFYLSSMIKTEMVVQKRPGTISTCEELLAKPNTKPLWAENSNDYRDFMNAKRNTAEKRIWERAIKFGIDSCFLKSDADVKKNMRLINSQEAVWLGPINSISVMVTKACAFHHASGLYPDVNMWYRSDENAPDKLNVMMFSAALRPDSVEKFNRIIQSQFEHHLLNKALKRLESSFSAHIGIKSVRDCLANRIIYPDHVMDAVHLPHYNRLWVLSGYFLLFCLLVLSSEVLRNLSRRIASKKIRDTWTLIHGIIRDEAPLLCSTIVRRLTNGH